MESCEDRLSRHSGINLDAIRRHPHLQDGILYSVVFLIGLVIIICKTIGFDFSILPGNLGDTRFNNYLLEHVFRRLLGLDHSFWTAQFYYPYPLTITFSDNLLGSAPFYIVFRFLGLDRVAAYQSWYLLSFLFNFLASVYVLSEYKLNKLAVAIGSFFFTFGLPLLAQEGHLQLFYRFGIPLSCYFFIRFYNAPNLKDWLLFFFFFVWQFYIAIYLGVFLFYLLIAVAIALLIFSCKGSFWERLVSWPRKIIQSWNGSKLYEKLIFPVLFIGLIALLVYLLKPYYDASKLYGFSRSWAEIASMMPRINSYFLSEHYLPWQKTSWLFSNLDIRAAHQLFIGFTASIVLIFSLVRMKTFGTRNQILIKVSLVAFLLITVFTLNINDFSFYRLIWNVPGLNSIRVVSRIIVVTMWPLSIAIACAVHEFISVRKDYRVLITLLVFAALATETGLFTYNEIFSVTVAENRLEKIKAQIPESLPKDPILLVGITDGDEETDAMLLAQELGWPTLNGYTGNIPPDYGNDKSCSELPRRIISFMKHEGITDESYYLSFINRVVPIGFWDCDPQWWQKMPIDSPYDLNPETTFSSQGQ